ncbi:hypothetical protein KC19_VG277400 [Ceratodon purpureus]|uniref:Uncharacterized protein n=1 Tax=Ceratodon purpureus TaxID=3225 RepID=A0A8T0HUH4_CERPU|nr:hypothetical protein KC19_VG277400 [Ceratodon purpureus]
MVTATLSIVIWNVLSFICTAIHGNSTVVQQLVTSRGVLNFKQKKQRIANDGQ